MSTTTVENQITVFASPNIATVCKYWGKKPGVGEKLILPVNDSISLTISEKVFRSKTSAILTDKVTEDKLWLNGAAVDIAKSERLTNVLSMCRATAPAEKAKLKAVIVSNNNFPTAAGVASSASGYCALACAIVKLFESKADVSILARIGSGSACRSVYGGFVKWNMGTKEDGTDSIAVQLHDHKHWPGMNIMCAVVKAEQKDVSSTAGMQLSLQTSPLMKERVETIAPARMKVFEEALKARDFATFADLTMKDSDDLQAICATTVPKIQYATQQSYSVIKLVHALNAKVGKPVLAYTYDAGANAFLFAMDENMPMVLAVLQAHFPCADEGLMFENKAFIAAAKEFASSGKLKEQGLDNLLPADDTEKGKPLTMLMQSPVGAGPSDTTDPEESLIDFETLTPRKDWKA